MLDRSRSLGLVFAAAGVLAGTAVGLATGLAARGSTALAGDDEPATPLHAERDAAHPLHGRSGRHSVDVVIDRTQALRRLDRVLDGIDDLALSTRTPWRRGFGPLRLEREVPLRAQAEADPRAEQPARERGGERPADELAHRGAVEVVRGGPSEIEDGLYALRLEVLRVRRMVEDAPVLRPAPVIVPMPEHAFRAFLADVHRARFVEDKVGLVRAVAAGAWFASDQAAAVLREMPSWGQVDAALALHPRLVDPENEHRLYAALTFSSDREALRRRLGGAHHR